MADEHISVAVQDDFVERQITRAKPIQALAELIWNSLDSDATTIDVELKRNDLAGELSQIVIYDNGDGFSRSEARALFGNLGGSWKRAVRETHTNLGVKFTAKKAVADTKPSLLAALSNGMPATRPTTGIDHSESSSFMERSTT